MKNFRGKPFVGAVVYRRIARSYYTVTGISDRNFSVQWSGKRHDRTTYPNMYFMEPEESLDRSSLIKLYTKHI